MFKLDKDGIEAYQGSVCKLRREREMSALRLEIYMGDRGVVGALIAERRVRPSSRA